MELFTLVTIIFLAILTGTITGLIPSLHINTISILLLINFQNLNQHFQIEYLIIFIIIMSLTHTFIDFIPSIIFGIPNTDTALSVLPGHHMILNGEGYKAIFYSSIGSLIGVISSLIIGSIFLFNLELIYSTIKPLIPLLLAIIVILGVFTEPNLNSKFWAIFIVLITGGYGIFLLNSNQISQPLTILFLGIFAIPILINSTFQKTKKLPKQNYKFKFKFDKSLFKSLKLGAITSSICSITPGVGNMQAATISSIFSKKSTNNETIISMLSLINTNNFLLSLITYLTIEKARNGSIYVISQISNQITFENILFYFSIIILISPIIHILTLKIGKFSLKRLSKLNIKKINFILLIGLVFQVYYLENIFGIFCLIVASTLGYLSLNLQIKRIHLLSALIIPIILNLI